MENLSVSINLSKLIEEAKKGNKAFSKSEKTGDIYLNANLYFNEERDKYGNDASFRSWNKDKEDLFYFGNGRFFGERTANKPKQEEKTSLLDKDIDLPF